MAHKDLEARRAYRRKYDLDRYHARRAKALASLGGKCVKCNTTKELEFDHVDPSTKLFSISRMWGLSKTKFSAELAKCQVLCKQCHKHKSDAEQRTDAHGTWGMHRQGCKCQLCRDFVNAYHREYKRQRRSARS